MFCGTFLKLSTLKTFVMSSENLLTLQIYRNVRYTFNFFLLGDLWFTVRVRVGVRVRVYVRVRVRFCVMVRDRIRFFVRVSVQVIVRV